MADNSDVWTEHELDSAKALLLSVGDLRFEAKRAGDEVWLSHRIKSPLAPEPSRDEQKWARWAAKKQPSAIEIVPSFPDKSTVVKPEDSFTLLPGVSARIFVKVPLWLSARLPGKEQRELSRYPTAILSLTWFGTPMDGELCYWISSSARREVLIDTNKTHTAICPVQLRNNSSEDLLVEKICLRVRWLSLFKHEGLLWANETRITYRGADEGSQVSVAKGAPDEAPDAEQVNTPHEQMKKSFTIRSFLSLRNEQPARGSEPD